MLARGRPPREQGSDQKAPESFRFPGPASVPVKALVQERAGWLTLPEGSGRRSLTPEGGNHVFLTSSSLPSSHEVGSEPFSFVQPQLKCTLESHRPAFKSWFYHFPSPIPKGR